MMKVIKILFILIATAFLYSCDYDSGLSSGGADDVGTSGSLARFAIAGDYMYTVELEELKIFNISDEKSPEFVKQINPGFGIETIFSTGNYLFLGSRGGVYIFDITNGENPIQVSYYTHVYSCDPVIVKGNYAYSTLNSSGPCGRGSNQLDVIDISDISNPTNVYSIELSSPKGLGISGDLLFVCNNGIQIYDLSNPEQPILVGTESVYAYDVIPIDNMLISVSETGIFIYQIDYINQELDFLSTILARAVLTSNN